MQHILSLTRRCVEDYGMIEENDRVAVGLSGGKDSLVTLAALARLSRFFPGKFSVIAITLDMGFEGARFDELADFCEALGVPFHLIPTQIKQVVFDIRDEKSPCSLCANMRRGALYSEARRLGCNKAALGHHMDDAAETFLLSLLYEGRISCFSPVTYLDRTDITVIRPLLYVSERDIRGLVRRERFPVQKSLCPVDGHTKRQEAKELISDMQRKYPGIDARIIAAMKRGNLKGWGKGP